MFIMSNLDDLANGRGAADRLTERAKAAGLVCADGGESDAMAATPANGDALAALESLGNPLGPTGRRSPERIMRRLASRMRQAAPESEFRAALSNVAALVGERAKLDGVQSGAGRCAGWDCARHALVRRAS